MSTEERVIEATGNDVPEAVAQALAQLGISREQANVEVIDEGSKGILGLGRRDAVVRVSTKPPKVTPATLKPSTPRQTPVAAKEPPPARVPEPAAPPPAAVSEPAEKPPSRKAPPSGDLSQEIAEELGYAQEIMSKLLDMTQIDAEYSVRLTEPDEFTGRQVPILDVRGDELSALIGPRAETLDAVQYVMRLMVSHRLKRRTHFMVDVDGYRERRRQALQRLAERMAKKALDQGRAITLEPMPANERRTIHITLREIDGVFTESTGEGEGRRVRILLEK